MIPVPLRSRSFVQVLVLALWSSSACGGESGSVEQVAAESGDLSVCDLLTDEQVSTILPDHDGGFVAASGESLVEGVASYQCSYTARRGDDFDLFTVILTVASDAEYFDDWIRPSRSAKADVHPTFRDVEIADGGFVYGEADEIKLDAWKGTTLISLNLSAPDAVSRAEALIALATTIVGKIG